MTTLTKFFSFIVLLVFASCNSGTSTTLADSSSVGKTDGSKETLYPYEIGYSTQFEIIDAEKSKMVLDLWKDFDNNTLDNARDKFADTVTMIFPGIKIHGSRDSIIAVTKSVRDSYKSVTSNVDVVLAVKSTDKKEDWVLVWGNEISTNKKNVTDTVAIHETWQLNKEGKVVYMKQYANKKAI